MRTDPDAIPLLAIVGPTGVGKTAVAVALAEVWPIEVVSVDSRQVYRFLDIGTAKPTAAQRARVRHHLIDVVSPAERYDAARFARDASQAIDTIRSRGRWPALVGGTGLYLRALLRGLAPLPAAQAGLRNRLRAEVEARGAQALHRQLEQLDPASAARLHPHDVMRVTRALEIVSVTGRPVADAWHVGGSASSRYRCLTIGVTMGRPTLYRRLDQRVDRMLAEGLVEEVAGLLRAGFGPELPAMQGIGYRHLVPVVVRGAPLAAAVEAIRRDTRRYAKRQWTWFAREATVTWLSDCEADPQRSASAIKKLVESSRVFA